MIGSRFSGIAVRKSEIAASDPLVPASRASSDDRSGKPTGLGASDPALSNNGLLCQREADLSDRPPFLEDTSTLGLDEMGPRPPFRKDPLYPQAQISDAVIES